MKISFFFTQPKGECIFINKIIDFSSFFLLLTISQFFFFASLDELKLALMISDRSVLGNQKLRKNFDPDTPLGKVFRATRGIPTYRLETLG